MPLQIWNYKADIEQLCGILDYRHAASSKKLADEAQYSAVRMEYMTQKMKEEAIFMRIITLVTLLFLPGTFVSVNGPESLKVFR